MNGLGLDDWLRDTITNASAAGTPLVELGKNLPDVELLPGDEPGTQNPHLWMAVPYAIDYVEKIEKALESADPANATTYRDHATAYRTRMEALDKRVHEGSRRFRATTSRSSPSMTRCPTSRASTGSRSSASPWTRPGQDPSAAAIAALITAIRQAGVKAIFSEAQFPTRLVDQIASETGAVVVANLYDDSLGDPPVTSYEALIDWDVDQIARRSG